MTKSESIYCLFGTNSYFFMGYEVDLSNGFEIEFDKKMNVIDIDR